MTLKISHIDIDDMRVNDIKILIIVAKPDSSNVDSEQAGYGMRITKTFEEMERPVKFKEDDAMAIDAVRMYAQYLDGGWCSNLQLLFLRYSSVAVARTAHT